VFWFEIILSSLKLFNFIRFSNSNRKTLGIFLCMGTNLYWWGRMVHTILLSILLWLPWQVCFEDFDKEIILKLLGEKSFLVQEWMVFSRKSQRYFFWVTCKVKKLRRGKEQIWSLSMFPDQRLFQGEISKFFRQEFSLYIFLSNLIFWSPYNKNIWY